MGESELLLFTQGWRKLILKVECPECKCFSSLNLWVTSAMYQTWSECICNLYDQSWGLRIHFRLKFSCPSPGPVDIISGLSVGRQASLLAQMVKNLPAVQIFLWPISSVRPERFPGSRRAGFDSWVGKIPWRRKCPPTPGFLPGELQGQRSLEGCSPWGFEELATTE